MGTLGTLNRIYTPYDVTGCFCLELLKAGNGVPDHGRKQKAAHNMQFNGQNKAADERKAEGSINYRARKQGPQTG